MFIALESVREQIRDQMLGVDGWVEVDRSGPAIPFYDLIHRELCRVHPSPVPPVGTSILSAPEVRAFELWQFVTNRR